MSETENNTTPENETGGEGQVNPETETGTAPETGSEPESKPAIEEIAWREVDKPYQEKISAMLKEFEVPEGKQAGLYKAFSALQDEISQDYAAASQKAMAEWESEQGDNLAKNQELAKRGSAALGLDADNMSKIEMLIGTKEFMSACLRLGEALSEDTAKGLGGSGATKTEEMSTEDYLNEVFNKVKG